MPSGIWLDSDTYRQSAGQLWAQQQMQGLQQRLDAAVAWGNQAQQQLQALVPQMPATPPAAPPVEPEPPPAPAPTPITVSMPAPTTAAAPPAAPAAQPPTPQPAAAPDQTSPGDAWAAQASSALDTLGTTTPGPIPLPQPPAPLPTTSQVTPGLQPPGGPAGGFSAPALPAPTPDVAAQPTAASGVPTGPQPNTPGDLIDQARQAAAKYGIDPEVFTRQIKQESGFNPNAKSGAGAIGIAQFMPATAQGMGIDPTNPQQSLDAAAKLDAQNLQRYGGDWASALSAYNAGPGNTPAGGGVAPFAETQTYVKNILGGAQNVVQNVAQGAQNVVQSGVQAAAGAAGGLVSDAAQAVNTAVDAVHSAVARTSQFAMGLSPGDAMAFCGPAAALAFAQTYGRNPTIDEAKQLASQVGWNPSQGMAGPSSEVSLLKNLGVDAHMTQGVDWSSVGQDAAGGNPVIIDTPGHYYYVDGYNAQTGQLHVGTSGTDLKGGSEWMTPQQINQMPQSQGDARAAIFADHPLAQQDGSAQAQPGASGIQGLLQQGQQLIAQGSQAVQNKAQDVLQAVQLVGGSLGQQTTENALQPTAGLAMGTLQPAGQPTNLSGLPSAQPSQQTGVFQALGLGGLAGLNLGGGLPDLTSQQPAGGLSMATLQPADLTGMSAQTAQTPQQQSGLPQVLGNLGGGLPDISSLLSAPPPGTPLANVIGGAPISQLSPTDQAQAGLQWVQGYEGARNQAVQQLLAPTADVPVLGGTLGMAQQLTDPLTLALFGAAAPVGGAVGGALGGGTLGGIGDIATQGALGSALTASAQPGATPSSIAAAAAQGAVLGGGLGAVGPLAGRAIPAATDLLGSVSAQDLLRSRLPGEADVNFALGGLPSLAEPLISGTQAAGEGVRPVTPAPLVAELSPAGGGGGGGLGGAGAGGAGGGGAGAGGGLGGAAAAAPGADLAPVTWADRLRLFHTGGVISDLATLSKVAMNSVLNPMWSFGTRSAADIAGLTGLAPGLSSGEALGRLGGGVLGAQSGLAGVGDALARGLSDVYSNPSSIAMRANNPLDQVFGRVFQTPAALHSALQQAGQSVLEQMELGRLAGQQAASEGLTGQAFTDRYAQLMSNPLPGWQDAVSGLARRAVLRGDLGTIGSTMANLARLGPQGQQQSIVGNILFPVFRVGMNALTQGVEKSPLGLGGTLFDVLRGTTGLFGGGPYAGGAFQQPVSQAVAPLSERLTNNLVGTALTAWLGQKAADGLITGNGPSDPDQRRVLMSSGWRPNSIMTPWGYASYTGTPIEVPAGLAGALGDALHNPIQPLERQEPVAEMIASRLLANTADMLASRTGIATIGQISDMLQGFQQNPVQAARQYGTGAIANTAGGFVPMSGLVRGVARATDPYMRQPPPGDVGQALMQNIPGLRQQVMPELSTLGQPIPNPQQGLAAFLPTRLGAGTAGPIETAMAAAGAAPSATPQTVAYGPYDQIRLNPQERQAWEQYRGQFINQMASDLVSSPQFQQMTPKTQNLALQTIDRYAADGANKLVLRDLLQGGDVQGRLEPTGLLAPVQGYLPTAMANPQQAALLQAQGQALFNALIGGQTGQQYLQDVYSAEQSGLI